MKSIISSVKGTREFYPQDMAVRRWLYAMIEKVSKSFGYQEYEAPFLERIDLYAAKSGEELVKEQAFVFPDKGGDLISLRPELTPSLARMVAQRQNELLFPLKWWSFGPFWRYERPQKGRTREFFQWNIDMIGVDTPEADAELVVICAAFLKEAGISPDQICIKVNHRHLMELEISALGIDPTNKQNVFHLIDRKDKLSHDAWNANAKDAGLDDTQIEGINKLIVDQDLWKKSEDLNRFFAVVESSGVSDYVQFDPRIIRGLDYYTGLVFEAWDVGGEGRSVLGGGHYANLVGDVGGDPLPGVGFAMGDVMITLLLEKYGRIPQMDTYDNTVLVTVFNDELIGDSFLFASRLRAVGIEAVCYPENVKLPKQLKYADRLGMKIAVVIGPDEKAQSLVTIKNLVDRTQETYSGEEAVQQIRKLLAR